MDTTERLENAIRNRPDNWIVVRDKESRELLQAWDKDTGRLWTKGGDNWFWID